MCNNHNYTTTQARIIRYGERACDDSIWPPHSATHTAITFPEATLTSRVRIKKEKETSSFYMNLIDPSVQLIQNNNHSMHFWKLPITGKQSSFSFLFSYCFLLQTSTPPDSFSKNDVEKRRASSSESPVTLPLPSSNVSYFPQSTRTMMPLFSGPFGFALCA